MCLPWVETCREEVSREPFEHALRSPGDDASSESLHLQLVESHQVLFEFEATYLANFGALEPRSKS